MRPRARASSRNPESVEGPLATASQPSSLLFTPDGQRILYEPGDFLLASVRTDGGAPPVLVGPASLSVSHFELDASGATVLFLGKAGLIEAKYSAPVGGGPAVRLVPAGSSTFNLVDPEISGASVYYRADATIDNRFGLYRMQAPEVSLALTAMPPNENAESDFCLTPNDQTVAFRADATVDLRTDLLTVPSDGSASSTTIATPPFVGRNVLHFALDRAGGALVYGMNGSFPAAFELHRVDVGGGSDRLLSDQEREYAAPPGQG